jgi:K(+)-stimulated pyrophosphate-energized sodium pump
VAEVVTSSREGGPSLNVLSGLTAGNFSAFWMGMVLIALMGASYFVSGMGVGDLMIAPAVFAFGLVAFGFLGMGPGHRSPSIRTARSRTTRRACSSSHHHRDRGRQGRDREDHGFKVDFEKAKHLLEENDGAGNTFKATAKPVLIGTAVVGATTMIFSIVVLSRTG